VDITISADDLVHITPFPFTTEIRVIVREKAGHQLLAGGDDAVGVDHTIVGVLGLAIGADMILRVDTSLIISGSKTSEDKSTYGSSGK
jgi:hypothetical protein